MIIYKRIILISFYILCILLYACQSKTHIKDITSHPRDYFKKEISIEGKVGNSYSLILVSYFTLIDETDSIYVITNKPLPQKDEKLLIKGEVIYYTLGNFKMYAIKESEE